MMNYNKGDKFIIEIDEIFENSEDDIIHEEKLYRIKGFNSLVFDKTGLGKLEKLDAIKDKMVRKCVADDYRDEAFKVGYNKGLNDAWECANKLNNMVMQDIINIYGFCLGRDEVFVVMTPQEAIAKLEIYEKQNEIKVGDVVINEDAGTKGVVAKVRGEIIYVLFRDGSAGEHEKTDFKKTGKHIDIQKILDELKEGLE